MPELIGTNGDGSKSLDYPKLTAYLIEAAKAQQKQIEALRKDVDALRGAR